MVLALYGMERAVVSIGGKHHKYISVPRHPNSNNTVKDIKIYLKFCTVSVISYNYQVNFEYANQINLTEFVFKTHATYAMEVCLYGGYNCAFDWKLVGTLDGACLELNPNDFPSYNSYERFIVIFSEIVIIFLGSLSIQVGMNVSDHFGGWHGNANKGISALHTCCNE